MTPDEVSPEAVDEHLLARMMAFDALLHADRSATDRDPTAPPPSTDDDGRARDRLMLLLRMIDATEPPPEISGAEAAAPRPDERDGPGPFLGRFEFLEDLGAGGFGFVVRARDRVLGRMVALKVPLPERLLAPGDVDRFLREARAAARLDHPHIVRVYDAGAIGPLGYFIASEFCEGPGLRRWLKDQVEPVPARMAARWAAALADAVQHAHDRGILHRDIKPDNVILAPGAGPGESLPRLTDFGLAKLIEEAGDETRSDARPGTLAYMSPEQAAGRRGDVGPTADVYALGATLHEVLTGRPPFRGETEAETLRLILEAEPVPPRSLRPGLPRDLETICLKCLRKEPARRYATASGLRDDLLRFLEGSPIRARRTSAAERAWRWCRRNRAIAGLLAAVFLLLATVAGVASMGYLKEADQRAVAQVAGETARTEADRARAAELEMRRQWYAASTNLMQPAWDAGQLGRLRELLVATESYPDRGFEWSYWHRLCHLERCLLIGHRAGVRSVSWSPDGARLATASWDRTARVWDLAAGREVLALRGHAGQVNAVAWSPDGARLATASWDRTARVWGSADGREVLRLEGHAGRVWTVAWSPDGTRLATGSHDGTAKVWDAARGRELVTLAGHAGPVVGLSWAPDGKSLATTGADGTARVWDAADGGNRRVLAEHGAWVNSVAWSPDGTRLATASWDGRVRVWEAASGRLAITLQGHAGWVNSVSWSPDGKSLAMGCADGTARVRDAAGGRDLLVLKGGAGWVNSVSWSSDGKSLAMGGADGTARVWDLWAGREPLALGGHWSPVNAVSWSPDGARLATASWDGTARIRDAIDGRSLVTLEGHNGRVWSASWSPDGSRLATGNEDGTAKVWDAEGRERAVFKGHTGRVVSVDWSPDGTRLATGSWDGTARIRDAVDGREILTLEGHTSEVWSVSWSPDGTRLATGTRDGTTKVWDAARGGALLTVRGHEKRVVSVDWSPDGTRLATASVDGIARVWGARDGRERFALEGHTGEIRSVSWSPDGRRLATASADGTAKVWDAAGGRELLTLRGHTGFTRSVSWSPDGRRLATAGDDGTVKVWETAGGEAMERWARRARAAQELLARNDFRDPRARGYIRSWLVLVPVPLAPGEGGAAALDRYRLADEANLKPRAGDRVVLDGRERDWLEYRSPEAVVDFNAALGRTGERSLAYAVCYLETDRPRDDVWLQVGSDDQAVLTLNGREIFACPVPRPLETLDTVGPIALRPGTNVLLLKVANETSTWEGCVRLVDGEGAPVEGIRVKLSP